MGKTKGKEIRKDTFDAIRTKRKGTIKEAIHATKNIRNGITNETTKKKEKQGKETD